MIKYLNKYGEELPFMDFIELQWNRKYKECGSFVITMAAKDYSPDIKYIKNIGRPETGIVQKTQFEETTNGKLVTLSGSFLERALSWGQQWCDFFYGVQDTPYSHEETYEQLLGITYANFSQFFPKEPIDPTIIANSPTPLSDNLYGTKLNSNVLPPYKGMMIPHDKNVMQAFYDFCETDNYSFYCEPIFNAKEKETTEPMLGVELTFFKGQDLRDTVYFGDAFSNVQKIDYVLDESAEFPEYVVIQQIEYATGFTGVVTLPTPDGIKNYISERVVEPNNAPSDIGTAYPVKVFYSNITGIEMVSANESKIRSEMRKQATVDMLSHYKVENIAVDVLQERFLYLHDYDLGDICSIIASDIEQMFTARIVEIYEVHKENRVEVQVVMGTPQKTRYRRIIE